MHVGKEQVREESKSGKRASQGREQVRKGGLPPLLVELKQRGQAPLPDLLYS